MAFFTKFQKLVVRLLDNTEQPIKYLLALSIALTGLSTPSANAQAFGGDDFPSSYNNLSLHYRNVDIEDYNMNGFGFEWIHGFSLSEQTPLYFETGAGLNMCLKDEGSGSWAGYGYIDVPLNLTYRFSLPNSAMNLSPFIGVVLKGNIIGTSDIATDTQEWYSDYDFKRFQLGWHVGCSVNYKKLHASVGYGTDFIKIAKKIDVGTFSVGIGFNW